MGIRRNIISKLKNKEAHNQESIERLQSGSSFVVLKHPPALWGVVGSEVGRPREEGLYMPCSGLLVCLGLVGVEGV